MSDRDVQWQELDACGEDFVRKHRAMGHYSGDRLAVVDGWLMHQESLRQRRHVEWTRAATLIGAIGTIVTLVKLF